MIIDFTVRNFRSFKDEQLFSLYAENKPKYHGENIHYSDDGIGVLRSCGIYGANASGKSNLISAIEALCDLTLKSAHYAEGDEIECYDPYLLDEHTKVQPTYFDIEFIVKGNRYSYQVEFTSSQVTYEKLSCYPTNRAALLFERKSATDYKNVKFGERLKGGKKRLGFFANNSYLSKAGYTPESPPVLRDIFNFLKQDVFILLTEQRIFGVDWKTDNQMLSLMSTFLNKADLGIKELKRESRDAGELHIPDDIPDDLKEALLKDSKSKYVFYHHTNVGEPVKLQRNQQSLGTLRMFELMPVVLLILKHGDTICIDEIEQSFHPHIAELIIKLFNDPSVNVKGAQLIYTTHNVSLMSSSLLRKDQIYFVEKSVEHGSRLYNLESFDSSQLKDSSPFGKWYDEGRLGAVPQVAYKDIADAIRGGLNAKE